jgi:general secretion pathway protein E
VDAAVWQQGDGADLSRRFPNRYYPYNVPDDDDGADQRRVMRWKALPTFLRRTSLSTESMLEAKALEAARGTAEAWSAVERLSRELEIPVRGSLKDYMPAPAFLERIGIGYARQHRILGVMVDGRMGLAIADRDGLAQVDILSRTLRQALTPLLASEEAIMTAINAAYSDRSSQASEVLMLIDRAGEGETGEFILSREDLLETEGRAPIIQLVNQLLFDAVKSGASDIHIQPYEDRLMVRQRIDGVLLDSFEIPKRFQEEVLTRVKVLGGMNIAEKRLPQDGRATVQLGERVVDLRIASLPTSHNERIVIRFLDKSARLYTLDELGMPPATLATWQQLIRRDHGMILVTGPTGSGKSTTLYGALQEINSKEANILTLEDPIEYQLDGISQTQINEKKGMTFASGMRSVLRQDPDIIMVGEIRDRETANMAIQASLTGHLVFSTLHTNDAASAITRLLDLGVEPYLVASSLIAALAQRLVRRLCPHCKRPAEAQVTPLDFDAQDESSSVQNTYEAVGCVHCRETGFRGRVGIFELLVIDDPCRELIQNRRSASEIRELAVRAGLSLLRNDGAKKILAGLTTREEVLRVTSLS